MLLDRRDVLTAVIRFCLDDPDRPLADEENVIGGAGVSLIFPNRDAGAGPEVDLPVVLNRPAGFTQPLVDHVPRCLLGCLVGVRHHSSCVIGSEFFTMLCT